jgi:hypothetical protein
MLLRCTTKMLALLGVRPAALIETAPTDDDWYLNLLWIERRKCLLFTHAGTLFPIFLADVRKVDLLPIGPYMVSLMNLTHRRPWRNNVRTQASGGNSPSSSTKEPGGLALLIPGRVKGDGGPCRP